MPDWPTCVAAVKYVKNLGILCYILGPEIIHVRGCENVAGKLRQKW